MASAVVDDFKLQVPDRAAAVAWARDAGLGTSSEHRRI